jgi:hypothetical protein
LRDNPDYVDMIPVARPVFKRRHQVMRTTAAAQIEFRCQEITPAHALGVAAKQKGSPMRIPCLALLLALAAPMTAFAQTDEKPNIIFILADDKDYYFCKKHVANEKTWKTPSIFKNWRLAKFG